MERRDLLKGIAFAASLPISDQLLSVASAEAASSSSEQSVKKGIGTRDIPPLSPEYFVPNRFKGKTLIVTGCARGMGALAARRAAKEGANVVGVDWIEKLGEETMNSIAKDGGKVDFVFGDVSRNETCEKMVKTAIKRFGRLDYALNNAGVMDGVYSGDPINYEKQRKLIFAQVHEATDECWDNVMRTNATGIFKSLRAELRQMVKQNTGGAIVNVGSVTGIIGFGGNPAYVASKHAVTGLTRSAAIDYAAHGIRINSVNMAQTATPMVERALKLVNRRLQESGHAPSMSMLKVNSLLQASDSNRRDATPAEQVAVMLFLLSEEASNLTGGIYATDGGWSTY